MRRSLRPLAFTLVLVGVPAGGAASAHAAAPPRTSSLGWVRLPGAESCIGTRELALAVEARLGRAVFVSAALAEVSIDGRIEPAASGATGFQAHLTLSDARGGILGARDLDGAQAGCRALDEKLALVIALLIDPDAALAPRSPPPPAVPAPPRVVVEHVFVPVPTPAPRPKEPWRESFAAGATVAAGLLPRAGFAATVRAELSVGLSLVVPFDRARFYYLDAAKNQEEFFRVAPVAGLADAAVGVAFP